MKHIFIQKVLEKLNSGKDWLTFFCDFDESTKNQFCFMYDVPKQVKIYCIWRLLATQKCWQFVSKKVKKHYKINILFVVILFNLCLI